MIIRLIPHVHPCVPDGQCKRCAYMCWWLHIVRVVWAGFPVWLEAIWYHIKGGLQTPRMTYICPNHIARWHQSREFNKSPAGQRSNKSNLMPSVGWNETSQYVRLLNSPTPHTEKWLNTQKLRVRASYILSLSHFCELQTHSTVH